MKALQKFCMVKLAWSVTQTRRSSIEWHLKMILNNRSWIHSTPQLKQTGRHSDDLQYVWTLLGITYMRAPQGTQSFSQELHSKFSINHPLWAKNCRWEMSYGGLLAAFYQVLNKNIFFPTVLTEYKCQCVKTATFFFQKREFYIKEYLRTKT